MAVKVRDRDMGYKRLKRELAKSGAVDIGYFAGSFTYEDGIDITIVAAANEFGTKDIPERSFMRGALDFNKEAIKEFISAAVGLVLDGRLSYNSFIKNLGLFGKKLIQERIQNAVLWAKPNKPSTTAQKGSSSPLIDSGDLKKHIDFKEVKDVSFR